MRCVPPRVTGLVALAVLAGSLVGGPAHAVSLEPREIVRRADRQRGVDSPYRFRARITSKAADGGRDEEASSTVVEVRANGFARQVVFVLEPIAGDVMLVTPDMLWLRPRRLHRLTRIPPDLRLFGGASISDVTSVDVLGSYTATLRPVTDDTDEYVVDLEAAAGTRYPRAVYRVGCDDFRPLALDFLAASGRPLKSVRYADFAPVLGRTIPTRLVVVDHVYHDTTTIVLSDFQPVPTAEAAAYGPEYLLALPEGGR
jgi:hypothetical protein